MNSERKSKDQDRTYYVDLKDFTHTKKYINPKKMKELKGGGFPFMTTMYAIDDETAEKFQNELEKV